MGQFALHSTFPIITFKHIRQDVPLFLWWYPDTKCWMIGIESNIGKNNCWMFSHDHLDSGSPTASEGIWTMLINGQWKEFSQISCGYVTI